MLPRVYFALYGMGSLAMAIGDVFFPAAVGGGTSFGIAPGWMREIACFDLFLAFLCAMAFRRGPALPLQRAAATGMTLLSLLIGSNNFAAFLASGRGAHASGAAVHALAALAGVLTLRAL